MAGKAFKANKCVLDKKSGTELGTLIARNRRKKKIKKSERKSQR
jgi:hypothetical protein